MCRKMRIQLKKSIMASLYESLIFLCWSLTLFQLIMETQFKMQWFGVILSPTTLLIHCFALFKLPDQMQNISPLIPALQSNWLIMHVTVMILSYAALICGSLLSITYLCLYALEQNNQLQPLVLQVNTLSIFKNLNRSTANLFNQIDNYSYRIIGFGFPFLTIGILSGAIWANEAWGSYWSWDPKETWALITWLIFAVYLHTRYIYQWTGFKSSILGSIGFILIWVCYIGVNLIGKGLHSYGWWSS